MKEPNRQRDVVLTLSAGDVAYGAARVLHVPALSVEAGSVIALHGGNGTGKSSLLKAIARVQAQYTGTMTYCGQSVAQLASHRRAASGIRFLPQGRRIFARLSVHDHIRLALKHLDEQDMTRGHRAPRHHNTQADALLKSHRRGATCSGGEAKLVLLESLTVGHVQLLLLDEPYAGLDEATAARTTAIIARCSSSGAACIVADHTGTARERVTLSATYNLVAAERGSAPFAMLKDCSHE